VIERRRYLEDQPMDRAWARFVEALEEAGLWTQLPGETIPLGEALGRVTAEPVWAWVSVPHYHASAMDGYAIRAEDTKGASESSPLTFTLIGAGANPDQVERPLMACNTGHVLPAWANAVIMVEHVQPGAGADELIVRAPVAPWQHVRPMGEDMVATELVLPANHTLRPVDLGAIGSSGHRDVSVRRRPRVAILPTGSELISLDDAPPGRPAPGQIVETNSLILAAQVESWGGAATRFPIIPDDYGALIEAVREAAAGHDLVLINAGSSAGSEDYTVHAVAELGEVLVHGIAVRPGHPVIFGLIDVETEGGDARRVPAIGVPGYPVSAALTGELFVEPLLSRWLGRLPLHQSDPTLEATISRKVASPPGDDDFLRVTVGQVGGRTIASPLSRGAGVISSLVRADGLVQIPRFSEGLQAGDRVTVHLYRRPREIEQTILAVGSHDVALDVLAQFVAERAPGRRLVSANVGSLGGLVALRRGESHLGGSHLLDPETGEYNWRYVEQYLGGMDVRLVTLVRREQGLMVPRGNPQGIEGIDSLAREDVTTINRQRGAGTRLLLDYQLEQHGIAPGQVTGYDREEITHLAVAAAIASGTAGCGLGVRAAASALELDFIPVGWERFDLVIPVVYFEDELLAPLLSLLNDSEFQEAVMALPGYDVSLMGHIVPPPA
jgi:putative molybdopterin biosynthesis protein